MGCQGEMVEAVTLDSLLETNQLPESIGFIHCDAQGAENFIFSAAVQTLTHHRPVVLFEDNATYGTYLYDSVCHNYPEYSTQKFFDIRDFCMSTLHYSMCLNQFNGSIDTLLIP